LRSLLGAETTPAADGSNITSSTDDPGAPGAVEGTADSADGWHDSLSAVTDAVSATIGDLGALAAPPALLEAAAGLLDLELRVRRARGEDADDIDDRIAEARRAQGLGQASIRVAHN